MNYGFIIDNRRCIGCHACSTACKSENEVPLGVNRTWVKYVETGEFPSSRRHFQVTRCNHCDNPPCTRICPVTAMYQRWDGIVEFDSETCIGCKACMQACPYDAIYIDPDTNAAAKCHYCSHRIELNLEPACVVVCPEHAIIAGDMDNPTSEISRLLATEQVTVRKPEQGTAPKLFYINGNEISLHPTATARTPETFMWADVVPLHKKSIANDLGLGFGNDGVQDANGRKREGSPKNAPAAPSDRALRPSLPQGSSWKGPVHIGTGRVAEQMAQVNYNAQHAIPWHWPVPAYLVTKAIGSGIFIILSLGWLLGLFEFEARVALVSGFFTLAFIGLTTGLLVFDLEKPELFYTILTRPQWRSWLTRGAFILLSFTLVTGLWWVLEMVGMEAGSALRLLLLALGFPLAVGTAVYTAFLFGQAEGRDLWQSTLLPFHLVVQALMAGSGFMLLIDLLMPMSSRLSLVLTITFVVALIVDLFVTLVCEFGMPHASEVAAKAAHDISHGRYRDHFWKGGILLGHVAPLLLVGLGAAVGAGAPLFYAIAGELAILGLYFYEYAFVMAPQDIPNS